MNTPEDIGFVTFDELTLDDFSSRRLRRLCSRRMRLVIEAAAILFERIKGKSREELRRREQ